MQQALTKDEVLDSLVDTLWLINTVGMRKSTENAIISEIKWNQFSLEDI